jgi:hypothetical protein
MIKYHTLTNHKYIEQRRHDCEFREKQRQYYISYYQKRKERPNYKYQNIFFKSTNKKRFYCSFSFLAQKLIL